MDVAAVADGRANLFGVKDAVFKMQGADKRLGQHRRAADLVSNNMRGVGQDDLIAAAGVGHHRYRVAHRAAGHKQRRLLAEHLGSLLLQLVHGRVVTVDVVHLGVKHRLPHLLGRLGDGVAS